MAAESAGGKLRVRAGRGGEDEAFMSQGWGLQQLSYSQRQRINYLAFSSAGGRSAHWRVPCLGARARFHTQDNVYAYKRIKHCV